MASPDSSVTGFRQQQVTEEQVKAELILADEGWWPLIEQAEGHGYFDGQIEFLLDFSGVLESRKEKPVSEWDVSNHQLLQNKFKKCLEKANLMFNSRGLISLDDQLWERALLSIGDYLLPKGSNYSFLVNSATDDASWKRLLRGAIAAEGDAEPRNYVHQLWDALDEKGSLVEQLQRVVDEATGLDRWIKALVDIPEAIKYCGNRSIRWITEKEIYLLSKTQMNGTHAELFTYSLYSGPLRAMSISGILSPLSLAQYQSVIGTDEEPHICIFYRKDDVGLDFIIEAHGDGFRLSVEESTLGNMPELEKLLCEDNGFQKAAGSLAFKGDQEDILDTLPKLAHLLSGLSDE